MHQWTDSRFDRPADELVDILLEEGGDATAPLHEILAGFGPVSAVDGRRAEMAEDLFEVGVFADPDIRTARLDQDVRLRLRPASPTTPDWWSAASRPRTAKDPEVDAARVPSMSRSRATALAVRAEPARTMHRSVYRVLAVLAVTLAVLGGAAFGVVSFAEGEADKRADLRRAHVQTMQSAAEEAKQRQARAVRQAVRQAQRKAAKRLKRLKGRMQAAAAERADEAYARGQSAGYSSGSAAGYASGQEEGYEEGSEDGYDDGLSEGYDEGLTEGSDELQCSDDPDVWWLPGCGW